jgi:hypothetical protein
LYQLQQGPTEKTIIEQCIRQRRPLPDALANAPELFFGLELYYIAFLEISTSRVAAGAPVSWLSTSQYADALRLSDEQREDLFFFVSKMDEAYLNYQETKSKPPSK